MKTLLLTVVATLSPMDQHYISLQTESCENLGSIYAISFHWKQKSLPFHKLVSSIPSDTADDTRDEMYNIMWDTYYGNPVYSNQKAATRYRESQRNKVINDCLDDHGI
jgi:hypothetical protein